MSCGSYINCAACPCWGGYNKNVEWGDCYRVFLTLDPKLREIKNRFGFKLQQPFDPHDLKYIREKIPALNLPDGVRMDVRKETDLTFDDEGNERIKPVKIVYYQTHKNYICEEE
jgi:hypothetical protein